MSRLTQPHFITAHMCAAPSFSFTVISLCWKPIVTPAEYNNISTHGIVHT